MAHKHSVYDSDTHFIIDGVTRAVKNASAVKTMLVQHDHDSERFTFEIPRMVDEHDMSLCNSVQIHYINTDSSDKTKQAAGVYEVADIQISPDSDDVVICSWLISANATRYAGILAFVVRFACVGEDGELEYVWNTAIHQNVAVVSSIYNGEIVAEEYADILEQWRQELIASGGGSGAVVSSVEPMEDDIPKVFFGGALQQTKDEKVVSFRYISKTEDVSGYAEIKAQGNSSMSYPKKNQTVKLFKDAECTEKLKIDFKGWGKQNKFCFKANWIDLTHARNVVSARLWADVVKSRSSYAELPELLRTTPNQGAVDGFPIKVYANGIYQGRYTLNIPKDKWTFNMDDDLNEHCALCGENYASGCFRASAQINESDWTDEIHDTVPTSIKTRWNEVISFVMNSTDDEFKANIGNYFYIDSLIDYYLFGLASCGLDAFGKNQIYLTYDGQKWIASMYDMDSTWGLYWNGSSFVATNYARTSYEDLVNGRQGNLLYIRLEQLFKEELQARWAELKASALSIENIINRFERFTDIASAELVNEDYASTTGDGAFTGIPSKTTNNIQQIRAYALARQTWTDEYVTALSGDEGGDEPIIPDIPEHTHSYTSSVTTEATCTTDGVRTYTCSCGDGYTEKITATGHTYFDGVCTVCGMADPNYVADETRIYKLAEPTTFNGTSDYIDTGVQLFDEDKDFTVYVCFKEGTNTIASQATTLNSMLEESPYPGFCIRVDNGLMGTSNTGGTTTAGKSNVYIVTHKTGDAYVTVNGTNKANIASGNFDNTVLLGCSEDADGNKMRFWNGTIYACEIYNRVFTDEEITAKLASLASVVPTVWSDEANYKVNSGTVESGSNYVSEFVVLPYNALAVVLGNENNATFTYLGVAQYDTDKNFIGYTETQNSSNDLVLTLDLSTKYVRSSAFPNGNTDTSNLELEAILY